ncbi:MAG: hypothetical protein SV760_06440 [Halobacteria archaeon]|nr:hypothetical protein [Halobacteria archaeon]
MFDAPDQKRDLRYAWYVALIVFSYLIWFYVGRVKLLSFWIGLLAAVPFFVVTYVLARVFRNVGRITGLNKPVMSTVSDVKGDVKERIDEVVQEVEEEMEEEA